MWMGIATMQGGFYLGGWPSESVPVIKHGLEILYKWQGLIWFHEFHGKHNYGNYMKRMQNPHRSWVNHLKMLTFPLPCWITRPTQCPGKLWSSKVMELLDRADMVSAGSGSAQPIQGPRLGMIPQICLHNDSTYVYVYIYIHITLHTYHITPYR